jgi:biopolymer transport protein ExbD
MASRGFLIRFIDVGLIVLFGFIMISDIENSSLVDLGTPSADSEETDPTERTFITVRIGADGAFTVAAPETGDTLGTNIREPIVLETLLGNVKRDLATATEIVVLIDPDERSIVQHTVDVMDVCDRLALKKSLRADFGIAGA